MLKKIDDMPAGTLGFEAVGAVEDDDVEHVFAPALRRWTAEHGKIRLLYVVGQWLDEYRGDAMSEGAKYVAKLPTAFERVAVVSDADWIRAAITTLSILLPGDAKAFEVRELTAAKKWLAEGLDAGTAPRFA